MARPLDAVRERVRQNHPIAAALADGVRAAAARRDTAVEPADVPAVVEAVQDAIARDPVAAAQMSAEPAWQNRVKVGLYITGIGAVLKLLHTDAASWWEENRETLTTLVMVFGGLVAAIGEWASQWLAGIEWRRPWIVLGLGR
ncbi:MAG: hypothetical protein AB7O56_09575 [Bauldia sp.]